MSKGTTVHEDSRPMDENLQKLWWLKIKKESVAGFLAYSMH